MSESSRRRARRLHEARFPRTKRPGGLLAAPWRPAFPRHRRCAAGRRAPSTPAIPRCWAATTGTTKSHLLIGLGEGRLAEQPPGPLRHHRRAGRRAGRGRRRTHPVTHRGPRRPHAICCVSTSSATRTWTAKGLSCCLQVLTEHQQRAWIAVASNAPSRRVGPEVHRSPPRGRDVDRLTSRRPHRGDQQRLGSPPRHPLPQQQRPPSRRTPWPVTNH
jgi:hypothetical protein